VTGPATDNLAGTRVIEESLRVPAANARTDGERLAALVLAALGMPGALAADAANAAETAETAEGAEDAPDVADAAVASPPEAAVRR
jgi:hypothetical protein